MKKIFIPLILFLIILLLTINNYKPDTYLSGWDTLHPEFNMANYFKRIFFGVWQEHQGLGALATQAHASELPRMLIYYPLTWVLPTSFVRYSYFFLTLFLGVFGVYFFLHNLIFKNLESMLRQIIAFSGALFYLLNLGTMQQYSVPLEMFATHFATLGWLFLFILLYLQEGKRKYLILFLITTFFSAPMAHTATLWYSYFLSMMLFLLIFNLTSQKKRFKNSLELILLTILVNSFWLLPNIYFILTQGQTVGNSKIHELFTEEAFAQNAAFTTMPDLALFKNFLFNWGIYSNNNKFDFLLADWNLHLQNPFVLLLGYIFFLIVIIGIIYTAVKKYPLSVPFLSLFLLAVFFWMNIYSPLGILFDFLQKNLPLFKEAIRFPFTKFSILLLFVCSFYFAWGVKFLIDFLSKKLSINYAKIGVLTVVTLGLIYYMLPAFKGNFISPSMKVKIPDEYLTLFNWFDNQPQGRIASLPIHSFWGWTYYKWDGKLSTKPENLYQGAGFLWFGIKYPLLDREFDRWDPHNEQYYREMSYAIYTQNKKLFNTVLEKYQIKYILLDTSVIIPASDDNQKVLFYPELLKLLENDSRLIKAKQIGKNIYIYSVKDNPSSIFTIKNPPNVKSDTKVFYEDYAYEAYGIYITDGNKKSINYPVRNLTDNQDKILPDLIKIDPLGAKMVLQKSGKNANLTLSSFLDDEITLPADLFVERENDKLSITLYPTLPLKKQEEIAPIITEIAIPTEEKNFLLSINEKENFTLNNISKDTPISLGKVFLNTHLQNSIALYLDKHDLILNPDFSALKFSVKSCGDSLSNMIFGINPSKNGFYLFGKNTPVCLTIPLANLFSESDLNIFENMEEILLQNKFKHTDNPLSTFCVARIDTGSCVNYISKDILSGSNRTNQISEFLSIRKDDVSNLGIKIFLDTNYNNKIEEVSYSSIEFNLTKPFFLTSFDKDTINEALNEPTTTKNSNFSIPFSGSQQLSVDITSVPKTIGDCAVSQLINSPNNRINIVKKNLNHYIEYFSEEGSICDHFSYQNLSQNQAYLIVVTSRNKQGLPLRLCVTNRSTNRCDIYAHLSKSKDFLKDIFLLPPMNGEKTGFDININNFGVRKTPSINDLKSIEIIPFPYIWLSQIREDEIEHSKPPTIYLPPANAISHPNQSLYDFQFTKLDNERKIVVLSQSFNQGWKAYSIPVILNSFQHPIGILKQVQDDIYHAFPFLFGRELKDHVLVNNWSNGWIIQDQSANIPTSPRLRGASKNQKSAMKQFNNETIVFLFFPQYLEYIGFLILLTTIMSLFLPFWGKIGLLLSKTINITYHCFKGTHPTAVGRCDYFSIYAKIFRFFKKN